MAETEVVPDKVNQLKEFTEEHSMDKWVGKVAVVTGASSGSGLAMAKKLLNAGMKVVGLARRMDALNSFKASVENEKNNESSRLFVYGCDVGDMESVQNAFKWIEKQVGTIHVLVNNAGIYRHVNILNNDPVISQKLDEQIKTNIYGVLNCTRQAFPLMKANGENCYIVNINSIAAHKVPELHGGTSSNIYSGTKHCIRALSQVLRQELNDKENYKIRVCNLTPGCVNTSIYESAGIGPLMRGAMLDGTLPYLHPNDVAKSLLFILSTPTDVNVTEVVVQPTGERM